MANRDIIIFVSRRGAPRILQNNINSPAAYPRQSISRSLLTSSSGSQDEWWSLAVDVFLVGKKLYFLKLHGWSHHSPKEFLDRRNAQYVDMPGSMAGPLGKENIIAGRATKYFLKGQYSVGPHVLQRLSAGKKGGKKKNLYLLIQFLVCLSPEWGFVLKNILLFQILY